MNAVATSPALPDPRCAGPLVRRSGAPHSKELQRCHAPQKLYNLPRSGLTLEGEAQIAKNILFIMATR